MTLPALLFGLVLASVYGTAFHFWKGGSLGKLLLYLSSPGSVFGAEISSAHS